jgi:hypothetical protein
VKRNRCAVQGFPREEIREHFLQLTTERKMLKGNG